MGHSERVPASPPVFPPGLAVAAARVEDRIRHVLAGERERWIVVAPQLAEPLDALRDLALAGGKRLRPAFCHAAFVGAGGDPEDALVTDAGAALELVHTFALIHDDVMDGSATRRGVDSVHRRFARRHGGAGWRGEARRFGDGMAILVGDFAVVYADRLMRDAPPAALVVFDELRIELCVGQSLDLLGTVTASTDAATARRIATYKSGKYTVERPLHLGAALHGRLDELAGPLSAVGAPLGEAFQLRDDLLGVFGDPAVTGKPVGDDLREGKPTPLLAVAAQRVTGADRRLLGRLGTDDLSVSEVEAFQQLLVDCGAVDEVEAAIGQLVGEALRALDLAPLRADARTALADLARYVAWRDH